MTDAINGELIRRQELLRRAGHFANIGDYEQARAAGAALAPLPSLLVICDDLSLPVGKLRIRPGGSDGGQKGLRDIAAHLGTDQYPRLRIGIGTDESDPRIFEVVGVVGDVRPSIPAPPEIYVPHPQQSWSWMSLVVRTSGDPVSLAGALRREVAALDSELAVYDVRPLLELLSDSLAARRFIMALLGGFALLGLALATVGVYGVLAESVERRRGEIGLRLAVGANAGDVLRMVVGQAARLAAAGVILGLVAAFALTRVMQGLLFGVSATDPATFAAVAGVLATAALLASYLPARRAASLDPAAVLREE